MAGSAGSGKDYIYTNYIKPLGLEEINVDTPYKELLKAAGLATDDKLNIANFSQAQLSQAAKLMGKAQVATKEKYAQLTAAKNNIVINGTGAASRPLLKKKQELEALGYDTMMIMVWASPYTSLKRNVEREKKGERTLPPAIVLRTWKDVNKNVDTYKEAFGDNFVLVNNDPESKGKAEYNPDYVKRMFFNTVKGSGKEYTADERAKKQVEIQELNDTIAYLVSITPEFTSIEDTKSKINNFLK